MLGLKLWTQQNFINTSEYYTEFWVFKKVFVLFIY